MAISSSFEYDAERTVRMPNETRLYVKRPIPIKAVLMDEPFVVQTLEGTMRGKAGDYLITGVRGEQYPCDADIFEESYEAYEED